MSKINIAGNSTGTGTITVLAPSTNANRTINLPDENGTLITTGATIGAASGGTGQTSLTANNVLLGNGTSPVQFVAPGSNGNVLTSNGTTWTSAAPAGGAPTTQQVLNATAGFTANVVGSFCAPSRTLSTTAVGSTTAGSNIRGKDGFNEELNPNFSGTWRNIGASQSSTSGDLNGGSLYVRIS
jgi:hypothetical protein